MDENTNPTPPDPPKPPVPFNPASIYPEPTAGSAATPASEPLPGMPPNSLDNNPPKAKLLNLGPKKVLFIALALLVVAGGTFAALVLTNVITLNKFATVDYTNATGLHYKLDFYTKHEIQQPSSGNPLLVSKVSSGGKQPIALSINVVSIGNATRLEGCDNFKKVFEVYNKHLNQTISACDLLGNEARPQDRAGSVYIAGFTQGGKGHQITITHDYVGVTFKGGAEGERTLLRISGFEPYKADIQRILSSIRIE